jgi:poly(A) polymerase
MQEHLRGDFAFRQELCYFPGMTIKEPLIIPRPDHPISRSMISPNALRALYRLRDNGFTAYLVGGCVRDLLLGREPKDFDLVTDATPAQLKRLFRNCRLVGRRFRLAHLHFADEILEVATFRSTVSDEPVEDGATASAPEELESSARRPPRQLKSEGGMLLRDNLFGTPEEDARRRDFTVNALFYNIADFSIIDYTGGLADLQQGVIRTIGDPAVRITEDPVRMLRAVRFAAMLGLTVEAATWNAIHEQYDSIAFASPPRLYEEVLKLLLLGEGEKSYQLLRQTGLFGALFPRFNDWLDRETDGFPHTWVGQALDLVDRRILEGEQVSPQLLLALLFGQYLEEKEQRFRAGGAYPQQAVELALAELLQETSPTVQIPGRVVAMIRHILDYQHRFRKMPGRQPLSFIKRPGFKDALDYLNYAGEISGKDRGVSDWWGKYLLGIPMPAAEQAVKSTDDAPPAGKRRRRRRRKPKKAGEP